MGFKKIATCGYNNGNQLYYLKQEVTVEVDGIKIFKISIRFPGISPNNPPCLNKRTQAPGDGSIICD